MSVPEPTIRGGTLDGLLIYALNLLQMPIPSMFYVLKSKLFIVSTNNDLESLFILSVEINYMKE